MIRLLMRRMSLRLALVSFVFFAMLVSIMIIGSIAFLMIRLGIFDFFRGPNPFLAVIMLMLFSLFLGTLIAMLISNRTLKPLQKIIAATRKVAGGDFSVRLETGSVPEIEDLTASFNTMVQELGSIETLSNDFVNNFSHEFKTPIVSILGFARLLRNKDLSDAEREEYTEIIIQESERLSGFASNVLDLSKLENVNILTDKRPYSLDEQIRRVAALMEPRWREKNINVTLKMNNMTIRNSEDLLQQVWVNLLDNAIKFTGNNGNIFISLRQRDNEAEFCIKDDGAGMDEQTLEHIYDKFFQGDRSRSGSGHGLGLTLVKRIVDICGGRIEVSSKPDKGSAVSITLPAEV